MNDDWCKSGDCRNFAQRRGLCWKHYNRARKMTDETRSTNHGMAAPLGDCRCAEPVVGVIVWFGWGTRRYADREPQQGDVVECRACGRPLRQYMAVKR